MFERIISFSVKNKLIVLVAVLAMAAVGVDSLSRIPIDAVPDITNNQVQVVTVSPTLAAEEVEQYVTYPIESYMANIPEVTELRSISRYGLSVVTIVFEDRTDIMKARQFVGEQIQLAAAEIPSELGSPEMMPITTGLGEIYQYVLTVDSMHTGQYSDMDLRTIQDWVIKRQLAGMEGIIEVSSFGGRVRQYEVSADPVRMLQWEVTLDDIFRALADNNANSGGSYLEQADKAFYIRMEGRAGSLADIGLIPVTVKGGVPVRIRDVATVGFGSPQRYGAMTMDGQGEVVGGITLMLKGANSSEAIRNVKERIEEVEASLPEGVHIYPYLDRSELVGRTIHTVSRNLIEGGLIVIFIVVLLLGNWRAGLVVASVIPLSMLFALIMMRIFGVSANLMSLGAIDFGIVVDGAVIIVESVLHYLYTFRRGSKLSRQQMDEAITFSASQIYRSAAFGVLIILVVFVPIFTLEGIEGKMFLPMAQTVSFAVLGSLLLSLTYVPVISAMALDRNIREHHTFADRLVGALRKAYKPAITFAVRKPVMVIISSLAALVLAIILFLRMGAEFVPTLEEGDLAMQMSVEPGSSLSHSIARSSEAERLLKQHFPEVLHVVSKIGTAEVPTDPMAIEDADIMIVMKDRKEWTSADNREDLIGLMKTVLDTIGDASFEFTQPIQLRFNELMTGAKTDIAVKIYGEDPVELKRIADEAAEMISSIHGAGDVKVEQTAGLRQWRVQMDRRQMSVHGIDVASVNRAIRTAYAGEVAGSVYENERRFDLVVRFSESGRETLNLNRIMVPAASGELVPLSQVAVVQEMLSPMQISREDARRLIKVGVNVRDVDVATLVADIENALRPLELPPGYYIAYGGAFENLQHAVERLSVAVPVALLLILFLLYITFNSVSKALIIFVAVPLSAVGGVLALQLRGLPFSISAGIGFIALFGVAVLNGIVLMNEFIRLSKKEDMSLKDIVITAGVSRLRPVLMTAMVASLGFMPMALSTGSGAEVQRPLATVVIGGLITATFLTLVVLPALYYLYEHTRLRLRPAAVSMLSGLLFIPFAGNAQTYNEQELIMKAAQHWPALAQADNRIAHWEAEKRRSWILPPATVDIQYGQINEVVNDLQWGVDQQLGKPWSAGVNRAFAEAGAAQAVAIRELTMASLAYQVRTALAGYQQFRAEQAFLDSVSDMTSTALALVNTRREAGMLTLAEQVMMEQVIRDLLTMRYTSGTKLTESLGMLQYLCGDSTLIPDPDLKVRDDHMIPGELRPSSLQIRPSELAVEMSVRQMDVIRSHRIPDLSLGYFRQSLGGVNGFQGVRAGISIPILHSGTSVMLEQQELQQQNLQWQVQQDQHQLEMQIRQLSETRMLTKELLSSWPEDPLAMYSSSIAELQNRFYDGQIDVYQYCQQLTVQLEAAIAWIGLISSYNMQTIQLSFLTENDIK
ncbi:MAG: efflux RND transporter permease subunit [Chitinophagales bacterium]|nr:efflux RND transporter permease subunit [Chitinophagales bacterium]MCB9022521.1 efflux RND transporter permease subunit [Chitinophagales bacterium]HPE97726.1 CusA/CzcA family heavy metal efflux RND transporter [Chitinophagales bacterium]HRX24611.1 CusA/CzcA family heavy metal efflux RND transporter [Chitinophagales bacterium]